MVSSTYDLQGYVYRSSSNCWTINQMCSSIFSVALFSTLVDLLDVNGPEPG